MNSFSTILKRNILWLGFGIFLAVAFITHDGEARIFGTGDHAFGKAAVWLIWLGFLIYSLNISRQESFFKSLKRMNPILWSRQIGLDLYIGLLVPLTIIFLHEGSLLITALWFVPIFIFANLATLVYLALNFESLIAYFI